MTLSELMKCSKPLIFENDDEEFSYSLQGTGFLARFRSRYFGITAQHCLRTRTRESVRFELNHAGREFLPLKAAHLPEQTVEDDWDFSDLALFEVEPNLVSPSDLASIDFLAVDYFIGLPLTLKPTGTLVLRGYPSELNWVDYDRKVIHTQAFATDGCYAGPAEMKHCSIIRFTNLEGIDDLDGLSGSPVFQLERLPSGLVYLFAGVFLRGTKQSGTGRFVHASVIFRALQILSESASNPQNE